jgi:hypothetical protein
MPSDPITLEEPGPTKKLVLAWVPALGQIIERKATPEDLRRAGFYTAEHIDKLCNDSVAKDNELRAALAAATERAEKAEKRIEDWRGGTLLAEAEKEIERVRNESQSRLRSAARACGLLAEARGQLDAVREWRDKTKSTCSGFGMWVALDAILDKPAPSPEAASGYVCTKCGSWRPPLEGGCCVECGEYAVRELEPAPQPQAAAKLDLRTSSDPGYLDITTSGLTQPQAAAIRFSSAEPSQAIGTTGHALDLPALDLPALDLPAQPLPAALPWKEAHEQAVAAAADEDYHCNRCGNPILGEIFEVCGKCWRSNITHPGAVSDEDLGRIYDEAFYAGKFSERSVENRKRSGLVAVRQAVEASTEARATRDLNAARVWCRANPGSCLAFRDRQAIEASTEARATRAQHVYQACLDWDNGCHFCLTSNGLHEEECPMVKPI